MALALALSGTGARGEGERRLASPLAAARSNLAGAGKSDAALKKRATLHLFTISIV